MFSIQTKCGEGGVPSGPDWRTSWFVGGKKSISLSVKRMPVRIEFEVRSTTMVLVNTENLPAGELPPSLRRRLGEVLELCDASLRRTAERWGAEAPAPETTPAEPMTVSASATRAQAADGSYISWREHIIDGPAVGGVHIRPSPRPSLSCSGCFHLAGWKYSGYPLK